MEYQAFLTCLHEHLNGLFDVKIGKLAKELAEELSGDLMNMFGEERRRKRTKINHHHSVNYY